MTSAADELAKNPSNNPGTGAQITYRDESCSLISAKL